MITTSTALKITLVSAGSVLAFVIATTAFTVKSFGEKADKVQIDPIWEEIHVIKRNREVDLTIQQNMLKLMEKMDARLERIENNQVWQIQESVKRWQGSPQPPASTPAPSVNPLSNPIGR